MRTLRSILLSATVAAAPLSGGTALAQGGGGLYGGVQQGPRAVADLASFGNFVCGGDATGGMITAISAMSLSPNGGGTIQVPCNVTISAQIVIPSGIKILSEAAVGATNPLWSPNGTGNQNVTISCSNQFASCFRVNGFGIEIAGFQFVNPEPIPPSTGASWPGLIHYPPIIDTSPNVSWGDVYIHNIKCVPCSKFLDLEGTSTYTAYAGTYIEIRDFFCTPCLDYGITAHDIDNPLRIENGEWTPTDYYFSYPAVGAQLRTAVGLDFKYVAAPFVHHMHFFALGKAWTFENGTVTNNFGNLTFAVSALSAEDIQFDQVCQAIVAQGNGTNTSSGGQATDGAFMNYATFTTVKIWGDQSGFQCAKGKKLIQLETNQGNVTFAHLDVYTADQVFALGCGTPGTGSCSSGGPSGSLVVRLDDMDVVQYGQWTAGTPFMTNPSGVNPTFGTTNIPAIRPAAGAGNIMAPGLDGTQGYMGLQCVGGGTNLIEGALCWQGSQGGNYSGSVLFYDKSHVLQAQIGQATASGLNVNSSNGNVLLNPAVGSEVKSVGHLAATGTTPTIASGFGTSPSIAGSDNAGRITVGTGGAASGVVNFGTSFGTAPACDANDETTSNALRATASTTQLTVTGTMTASDKITFQCTSYN